jgi:hypothetical protein
MSRAESPHPKDANALGPFPFFLYIRSPPHQAKTQRLEPFPLSSDGHRTRRIIVDPRVGNDLMDRPNADSSV